MNGSRVSDQNTKARLAAQFNQFYLQITSPEVTQIGNYQIIKEIGEGAFGKVYLANHVLLNVQVVLKCGLIDDPNIVREVYYHRQLQHKNIVKLYEVIKSERHLWMALEYCEGSELFYYIYEKRRLEYHETKNLFNQIITGVKYVHSLNLAHRDLKLENILLADTKRSIVKLTDFGFVREFNPMKRQFLSTVCGTTVYMAPELIKNQPYSGFAIDIWSLGVILFTMLYGEMPFDEDDDLKTKYKIINEEPFYRDSIPQDAIELLRKMLSKDPRARPGLSDISNSSFLIDISNKTSEKNNRSSFYNDQESILSISQHYSSEMQPFQSKMDRNLMRKFDKLNIDIIQLQQDVLNGEKNPLTAFYELSLVREFTKKKKHYREKKRKYNEAKKSLINSRKKVKSALSLSEQGSGSQPLERIISSLSLSSNRNSISRTNLSKIGSRKSIEFSDPYKKPRGSELNRNSLTGQRMSKTVSNLDHDYTPNSILEGTDSNIEVPLSKIVTFNQDEMKRRPSNATTTLSSTTGSENLKKKIKNAKILNRLQFWKKNKNNNGLETARENTTKPPEPQYSNGEKIPLISNGRSPSPNTNLNEINRNIVPIIETQDTTLVNDNLIPNNENEIEAKNDSIQEMDNNMEDSVFESPNRQATPTLDNYPMSSKYLKTRPSSVVSQASQLSHLSQLSTMMSESDILGETDTMDEEEYDEDGIYESSLDNFQQDFPHRHSSVMTPTSGSSVTKKRPSYRRTLSSDISIMSTSTAATGSNSAPAKSHHQKRSLSRLSSNSSEESYSQSRKNTTMNGHLFASPVPTAPMTDLASDINSSLSPVPNRPSSPEGTPPPKKMTFVNSKLLRHSRNTASQNSIPSINKVNPVPQSYQFLNDNEATTRSHSPPIPNKFNKLKLKNKLINNTQEQPYSSKFSVKTTWPSKANQHENNDVNYRNMQLIDDNSVWNKNNNTTMGPMNGKNMYQANFIINEEEEDEN